MAKFAEEKTVTIQDVARHANVSTATVSRALSAPNSVSEKKRDAVMQAVRTTGYRVNRAARSLRTQQSHTVLALLPTLANPFFSQVLKGIADGLATSGQALMVAETEQIHNAGDDLLTYLEDQRADGAIVLDGALPRASLERLKASSHGANVVFACEWPEQEGFPSVRSANADGARRAVQHLFELGHRNIVHVTGPQGNVLTAARCGGYETACKSLGLPTSYVQGDFSLQSGVAAAAEILNMATPPTAVFCASDVIAFGVVSGLSREGLSVPNDISVVGFDDIEYSEHVVPPLTTIRQDRAALGQTAARILLQRRAEQLRSNAIEEIPVDLVQRGSTRRLV